jgi:plastocyanin
LFAACAFVGHVVAATLEARVADPSGRPVADAVVYAVSPTARSEARGRKAAVEQIDREFVPYVSVIQTGTTVTFPNRDAILHHVYSFSPAKTFEIKLYSGKSPTEVLFDKPGVITLGCNIHDWMIGYILVVSTPYFAKTDANGIATLRDLPAGSYDVRVWHPQQAIPLEPRNIGVDATAQAAFMLEVLPRKPKYKPPLDRLKY